jgi:hypothetical protein
MNKQKEKKVEIFEPDHSVHFMDLATSPLGKRLSRAGYTELNHLEAMLYLFGIDIDREYYYEELSPDTQRRSDYTKDIYNGTGLYVGYKRKDFNIKNLHKFVYGDGVDKMFDIITGGNIVD